MSRFLAALAVGKRDIGAGLREPERDIATVERLDRLGPRDRAATQPPVARRRKFSAPYFGRSAGAASS